MEFLPALTQAIDEQKPSLFELIASTQLSTLIPPSLRYILAVFTHRHPRYLLRVLNSFDELYALLMLVVERHYLQKYSGSFTENFYGLKRERCLIGGEIPRSSIAASGLVRETLQLGRKDIWKNLAILVGIPYVKRKLDESYDINAPRALLGGNYTRMPANPTFKQRILHYFRWFLRNVYPSVNAAYYFAILAFNVAYLFDGSRFHDPFLWLVGSRMRRLGRADFEAVAAMEAAESGGVGGESASGLGTTSILHPRILGPRLLSSLKLLLPTSIFALKFLEWWHASDFARQLSRKASEGLELPPPVIAGLRTSLSDSTTSKSNSNKPTNTLNPSSSSTSPEQKEQEKESESSEQEPSNPPISASSLLPIFTIPPPKDSSLCPICEKDITTATACQTGYVFCYTCIHRWIEGGHDRQESFIGEGGRDGKWESGKGRCAVSGRKVLGGTEGLRKVIV